MIAFPHSKINLGLNIVSKRDDGYHEIETCFYPVPRTDILEIIPAKDFSFSSTGVSVPGPDAENLCIKAFRLIQNNYGIEHVKIHLHKIIPVGAGMGGGSSDASFTLRLLNRIFDLAIPNDQLKTLAAELGSDCAFFINDVPMFGSGRGENLSPISLNLAGYHLVLVNPNIHISTREAYSGVVPKRNEVGLREILNLAVVEWKGKLYNDFEESIFEKLSMLSNIKENLYKRGASYAGMSGSGSTIFGLFENFIDLKDQFPGMDYWSGELK